MHTHADVRLSAEDSPFARTDAITSLKRAIDHRARKLDECYDFRSIPIRDKPQDHLDLLGHFGLIRPTLLRKLRDIRNRIEHQDDAPPDLTQCRELSDFVWFFLRVTDRFVQRVPDLIVLKPDHSVDGGYFAEIQVAPPDNWAPALRGWLPAEWVSTSPKEGWLSTVLEKIQTASQFSKESKQSSKSTSALMREGIEENDVYVHGIVRGPASGLVILYRAYFNAE